MKRKKWLLWVSALLVLMLTLSLVLTYRNITSIQADAFADLEGTIYYTRRVDGVTTLFKADAKMQEETLIYSHVGKGKTDDGSYNDNIIAFHYDNQTEMISFVAMHEGNWSLFQMKEGEETATYIAEAEEKKANLFAGETDYLKPTANGRTVMAKEGSIYLIEEEKETCLKRFYGMYDGKFTGYNVRGLTPDGNYLIYYSSNHMTAFGAIIDGYLTGSVGHTYIMDIETGKSARCIDFYSVQWVLNEE